MRGCPVTARERHGRPEVWGPGEIARSLHVNPRTVRRWREREDFPVPQELEQGPVWYADDVRAWVKRERRRRRAARAF